MASLSLYAPLEGWACSLDEVPDAVFAERMLGDGVAIDPTGDTLIAPCDARIVTVQPTGHAITLRTAEGAELLIHIGLDTVALKGEGFETLVVAGDTVTRGQPLIRFDLDRIVREARAAVTPIVVTNGDRFTIAHRATGAIVASGDPVMTLTAREAHAQPVAGGCPAATRTIVVPLPHGIHARPAARIAEVARGFDAVVTLAKDGAPVAATSPVGLLSLIVAHNDRVTIAATGAQAEAAVEAVAELILHGIKEDAAPTPPRPTPPAPRDVPAGAIAGVTAAPGLAIGTVARWDVHDLDVPPEGCGIAAEEAAFTQACAALSAELTGKAAAASGPMRAILDAHAAMLSDDALLNTARAAIADGHSAAYAWRAAIRPQADALRAGGDPRLAERADDMRDLERQLIARLMGIEDAGLTLPEGAILLAEDLLPSQFMALDLDRLAGLAIMRGGPTSHVSILAAARGVPTLVALGDALRAVAIGSRVILDAGAGWLHPVPSPETLADAEARVSAAATRRAEAFARAGEECRTADGARIELFANCGSAADADYAVRNGAEGCGLLRTELLFLDRDTAPDVAEQTADYQAVVDALDGRPLIIRLLDIGGDKPAPYLPIEGEENPALGLRGVRVVLAHPHILEDQLKAILAVRPLGRCRIMVPMIAGVDELLKVRAVLDRLTGGARDVELGVMVETPAAAIGADLLAAEADFLSIGTNDLTQYTLAMDRGNAAVAGALDGLHPAVLRLIGETVRGGALRHRWTGVCGSLASDPLAVPILLGLGVTELSVAPAAVPEIKALVRDLDLSAARDHARAALACPDAAAVRRLAREFAR
ncbi:phosphoenolpyruvate--protein phosphotransferase [Sphingomonas sp. 8AM]|uniref:phosphoenolpyruvate--protein phosphotransferase n=1 Tax=Sphingomonas sp. 8AM TaxID=2653170 RepID=UPI0012F23499|nr:phosphoenolpyruvate--protein phosphotransferase [Sphingomonas sp. 8AM]VXD04049.1 Phosphoenolpyruvate-protein phosphotransferase / Phosphocarrier protein HPr / PTS system fructose-specific EIIA component [Sphingomonas sp. 8AM]